MTMIVAGHFDVRAQAEGAALALIGIGISADHIKSSFAVNAPDWRAPDPFATYAGAFSHALDNFRRHPYGADPDTTLRPPSMGVLLAVDSPVALEREGAAGVLRQFGARNVVESERTWRDGKWADPVPDGEIAR